MKLVSADAILEISKYTIVVHDKLLFKTNIELTALSLKAEISNSAVETRYFELS